MPMSEAEIKALTEFPPRDLIGYGKDRPHPHWPNNAKIAVQFVIVSEKQRLDQSTQSNAALLRRTTRKERRIQLTMAMPAVKSCSKSSDPCHL